MSKSFVGKYEKWIRIIIICAVIFAAVILFFVFGRSVDTSSKIKGILTIECTRALDTKAFEDLTGFIPADGYILKDYSFEANEGASAYDVLRDECEKNNIQLDASYSPGFDSYYVEGINYLYEFDCGTSSGWIYKVDGKLPEFGASGYELKGGEDIVWSYTLTGF